MSAETKPANPPAFPTFEEIDHWDRDAEKYRESIAPVGGMQLRDWFAGKAMSKIDVPPFWADERAQAYDAYAKRCYEMADAMLKAREQ